MFLAKFDGSFVKSVTSAPENATFERLIIGILHGHQKNPYNAYKSLV